MCVVVVFRQVLVLRSQNQKNPVDGSSAHLNRYKRTKALIHGHSNAQPSTRRSIEFNFVRCSLSSFFLLLSLDGLRYLLLSIRFAMVCAPYGMREACERVSCGAHTQYRGCCCYCFYHRVNERHRDGRVTTTTSAIAERARVCMRISVSLQSLKCETIAFPIRFDNILLVGRRHSRAPNKQVFFHCTIHHIGHVESLIAQTLCKST